MSSLGISHLENDHPDLITKREIFAILKEYHGPDSTTAPETAATYPATNCINEQGLNNAFQNLLHIRQRPRSLRRISRNQIHQRRRQNIIRLQPILLELAPNLPHPLRPISLLNNRRHKSRKLRLLPTLRIRQLSMHEIQALKRMILLNAPVQMHATVLARVTNDAGCVVDGDEFLWVCGDAQSVAGDDADD